LQRNQNANQAGSAVKIVDGLANHRARCFTGSSAFIACPTGRTVFAQLIAHLSRIEFQRCVTRSDGDQHHRSLSCWDQYLAMAFAQFTSFALLA
jgi:hypothetical protein